VAKTDVVTLIPKNKVLFAVLGAAFFVYGQSILNICNLGALPKPPPHGALQHGFAFRSSALEGLMPPAARLLRNNLHIVVTKIYRHTIQYMFYYN